jgi:hypothetical protein
MRLHQCSSWLLLLLTLFVSQISSGAEIRKVKANAVLMTGIDAAKVGDILIAVDENGKSRAIIEITKVHRNQAAGKIRKGKAKAGMQVRPRRAAPAKSAESQTEAQFRETTDKAPTKIWIGGLAGFSMDSIAVSYSNENVTTSGTGFSLKGLVDYHFSDFLTVRGTTGYEAVNATGNSTQNHCNNGASCSTSISYFTFDFIAKFNLLRGHYGFWAGGGLGFAIPLSKDTNILAADSITTANIVYISTGSDIVMSPKWTLPIQIDYALFMPQTEVKTNLIAIRVGALFKF